MDADEKYLRREETFNCDEEIMKIRKELHDVKEMNRKQPHNKVIKYFLMWFVLFLILLLSFLLYLIYIRDGAAAFM